MAQAKAEPVWISPNQTIRLKPWLSFNVLSILNFKAASLFSIDSSNSTFSNFILFNFHSKKSVTSTVSVFSSTLTANFLLLDRISSDNFIFFKNSNGSISDSDIQFVNSTETFMRLSSSSFRFGNVTTVNANVTSIITLDSSALYCHEFIISRVITNSVLVSKDSIIALSNKFFLNSTSLSFTNSQLSALFQASNSIIEFNYVQTFNISFSQPIIYYVFNISDSQFLLANFYADVINVPIITARDSQISLWSVHISLSSSDILFDLISTSFTLSNGNFSIISSRVLYSFNSEVILQDVRLARLTDPSIDEKSISGYLNLFHFISSNVTASGFVFNNLITHLLFYSFNSNMTFTNGTFSNIVLYCAFNLSDTVFTSDNSLFEGLTLIDSFVALYNSSCSLHLWTIQDIESFTLFEVSDSSLSISQLSVDFFESVSLFNISNSHVNFDQISVQTCKALSTSDEFESYFIIINTLLVFNNFKFSGCSYQLVFKSDFEITNSSVTLTSSTEVLFLSSLTAQNSSITFSSGYPIISKFASN
ncbi:hypothetical protein GEMRC1_005932 [Eukaryota sp. GEM-RC1]